MALGIVLLVSVLTEAAASFSTLDRTDNAAARSVIPRPSRIFGSPVPVQGRADLLKSESAASGKPQRLPADAVPQEAASMMRLEGLTRPVIIRALVSVLAGATPILIAAFAFALLGPPRVPEPYETSIWLFLLLASFLAVASTSAYAGWLAFHWARSGLFGLMDRILGALLWMPILILVLLYVFGRQLEQARLRWACGARQAVAGEDAWKVVHRVARDLGWTNRVHVWTGPGGVNPAVFGVRARDAILVLPEDLRERARQACDGDAGAGESLVRLVVAHEVAHIRNGDIGFAPLLTVVSRVLPVLTAVTLLAGWAAGHVGNTAISAKMASSVLWLVGGGTALLFGAGLRIHLARERLADATAALALSESDVESLSVRVGEHVGERSSFERLLFGMTGIRSIGAGVLGFQLSNPLVNWIDERLGRWMRRRRVSGFRAVLEENSRRVKDWADKTAAFPQVLAASLWSPLAIGGGIGLLLAAYWHFLQAAFLNDLETARTNSSSFAKIMLGPLLGQWTGNTSNALLVEEGRRFLYSTAIAILVVGLMVPVRDMAHAFGRSTWRLMARLVLHMVAAVVVAAVVLEVLAPGRPADFPRLTALSLSVADFAVWTPLAAILILTVLRIRLQFPSGHMPGVVEEVALSLAAVLAGYLGCAWILRSLPWGDRLLVAYAIVFPCMLVASLRPVEAVWCIATFPEESIRWVRLGPIRRLLIDRFGGALRIRVRELGWFLIRAALFGVLFPCLLALAVRGNLSRSAPESVSPPLAPTASARGEASRMGIWSQRKFSPMELATAHARLFAKSRGMSFPYLLALLTIAVCGGAASLLYSWRAVTGRRSPARVLERASPMARLMADLDMDRLRNDWTREIAKAASTPGAKLKPYVSEVEDAPLLGRTCGLLECCSGFRVYGPRVDALIAWVEQCEHPGGGFGPEPKAPATLQHTAAALQALGLPARGMSGRVFVHRRWVRREVLQILRNPALLSDRGFLRALGLAATAWEALGPGPLLSTELVRSASRRRAQAAWRAGSRRTKETLDLLRFIAIVGGEHSQESNWIRDHWTSWIEARLVALRPDYYLPELADGIEVLRRLYPVVYRARPSVSRVKANIVTGYLRRNPDGSSESDGAGN